MEEAQVREILAKAAHEKDSYPKLFKALREAGVERYETDVLHYSIKYVGGKTSFVEIGEPGFNLTAGAKFDVEGIKKAVGRTQRGESTYPDFLREIAAAGCAFYRVDMMPRTVTYHGAGKKDKHVEDVPKV